MKELKQIVLVLLLAVLYAKFLVQIVLDESNLLLDLLLYTLLFVSLIDRKIRPELFIVFFFALISAVNPASKNIFLIFATVYALREFSIRELATINLCMQTVLFLTTCLMLISGTIHSEMFMQTLMDQRERWDFGYGNPNTFALFIYSIAVNFYILFIRHYPKLTVLSILILALSVYAYTKSRTFLVAMLILILVTWILKNKSLQKNILTHRWPLYLIPGCFMWCILAFSLGIDQYRLLDFIFSGRLQLYNAFLGGIDKTAYLIGTPLVNENTIDSSYLHILFEGGALAFIIFYLLYIVTIRRMNTQNVFILPVLLSFLAFGLSESLFTFVLIFGNMIVWSILYREGGSKRHEPLPHACENNRIHSPIE